MPPDSMASTPITLVSMNSGFRNFLIHISTSVMITAHALLALYMGMNTSKREFNKDATTHLNIDCQSYFKTKSCLSV